MDPLQSAQLQYQDLLARLQAGAISREEFDTAVAELRVQDAQGTWWSISPATGGWCYWDGAGWIEAGEPQAVAPAPTTARLGAPQPPGPDAFDQTAAQYRDLLARHKRGELDAATFDQAVAALRVTDGGGGTWQIISQTGVWVRWDGRQWVEAEPPIQTPDGAPATEPSIYAEFDAHYQQALAVLQQGGMSEEQFQARVARLRVKDEQGVWWQIIPDTGQWARWNGQQWMPADPPRELVGAIGPVRKFAASVVESTKAQVKETVRSIPRMIMWWVISRGIMMAVSYFGALYLHAYLCGYKNDGIRDDGGNWAPWLYLTGTRQGALSAPVIWGVAGMLLTTLVMTLLRRGPVGAVMSFVRMPFSFLSMLKSGGRAGAGAIAMGAGAAVMMKHYAGMNSQASYCLSLGVFLMGMGTVGRVVSGFFLGIVRRVIAPQTRRLTQAVEQRLPIDLRTVQLVLIGISPGLLLAARLGAGRQLMAGIVLLALGFVLLFRIRRPGPSAGAAAVLFFYGFLGSVMCLLLDILTSRKAFADDGGAAEFGGPPEKYWDTESGKLLDHSKTPAESSAAGAAAGGDAGGGDEPPPPQYSFFLTLDEAHMNLDRSMSEDVRARVEVTGPDPAVCASLSDKYTSLITFAMTGNCTDWFTWGQEDSGGSMRGYFTLQVPEDAGKIPGPHLVAFTASVATPNGTLSRACRIAVSVAAGYELRMSASLSVQANGPYSSLFCAIACTDDTIPDSKQVIDAAIPKLEFKVEGAQTHWVHEPDGAPGIVLGQIVPDGKEALLLAEVPLADLSVTPPYGVSVTASVEIPNVGSLSQVCTVEITPPEWFIEGKIIKNDLVLDFKDSAEICARLIPADESKLSLYGSSESNPLNNMLQVRGTGSNGQYAVFTEKEGDAGFRTWAVTFSQNLPPDLGQVEPTMDVEIVANITGQTLTLPIQISLIGKPSLEVEEKSVGLRAGGDPVPVHITLKDGGEAEWSLTVEILNLDEVEPDGPPETEDRGKWTLRLRGGELPEGDVRVRSGTLKLTAHATNPKTGEEMSTDPVEVDLKLGQAGLSVSPSPVKLPLDPVKEQPTFFKVRVLKHNEETGAFEPVLSAMQVLDMDEWEDGDVEGGGNTFKGAGVELLFVRLDGSGSETVGIWSAKQKIQIPASQLIDACRVLRAPGDYGKMQELFELRQRFVVPVDPAALQAEKIRIEQENCRKTLKYVPEGPTRDKFASIIEKDAKNLGAEGLYHLRHEIWEVARQALTEEAESYLFSAKVLQVAEEVCDWVNYVCKLIVQGMSSVLVPFPGDMVVNLLMDAVPDLVNAVWSGKSATDWAKQFANNFVAGLPGMGVDVALGQVINLEDMVKKGVAQFKDLKKACLVACVIYWEVRFVRYQVTTKPDGEPFSLKESMVNALRDLAEEIITTGISKNTKFVKEGMVAPGATGWIKDYDPTTGHGYDPKDGRVYHGTTDPPDTSGMPKKNLEAAQKIAKENGVEIYIRPTNPASKKLLEQGAIPKPESIKAKTINEQDIELGCRPEDLGKVGYFNPKKKPEQGNMSKQDYDELMKRYNQRRQEFADNAKDFKKLKKEGVHVDEHGVVTKDGKCYTGDHDIYDIRGKNGEPVDPATYKKVYEGLRDSDYKAQHPGHRQWDYSKLDKYTPPPTVGVDGKPIQSQSKYNKAKSIDGKIMDSHQAVTSAGKKGEALIRVGADGKVSGVYHNPPKTTLTQGGRATQSVASATRHDRTEREREKG